MWVWLLLLVAFFGFIYLIKGILLPFVVGILTAYFLDPAADRLEKWGFSRTMATTVIMICFFAVIIVAVIALLPLLLQQMGQLLLELPEYYHQLEILLQQHIAKLPSDISLATFADMGQIGDKLLTVAQEFLLQILQSGMVLLHIVSLLIITPVVAFYLLRDWDYIVIRIKQLLPRDYADIIITQWQEIDKTLAGFIRGQLNVMLILGIFYAVGLSIIGLKFALVVGFLSGVLIIIPYLGTFISGLLAIAIAYVQFTDWWSISLVGGYFVVGQMLEGYFLTPKLVGEKVGLHPVWVIFGMLAGGALFGFVGVLIALPVTAVIGVLVRFAVECYLQSSLYGDRSAQA